MKLNKFLLIFFTIALLAQTLSGSVLAQEACNCKKIDSNLSARLSKENLIFTRTLSDLRSETAKPCDKLALQTLDDINFCNKIIIPCGSIIEGKVVKVRNNTIFRSDAYIDFVITNIKMNSGCNVCLDQDSIKLRIVDPHYKGFWRRTLQRAPVVIAGPSVSIPLAVATNLNGGIIFAITVGAQATAGFISGLIDPDIDKTRIDGAIVRGVEGTPLGTFLITVEKGFDIDSSACCYVAIRFDDKAKQKIFCSLQKTFESSKNF